MKEESESYCPGEIIEEEAIESYFVWIPKYRYQLWDLGNYSGLSEVDTTKVHTIPLIFGDYNTRDSIEGECTTPMTSGSYKNEIQKFLKIVINWAVKTYGFNMNKFYGRMEPFTSASDIKKEMDFYTLEEFNQFISFAPNLQIKCMYETLYYCGLRRGEARGLQWKDVSWIDKRLSITKQAVTHGSENSTNYELTKPKTQKSNRILPIAEILFRDLKQLYEEQKQFAEFNDEWFIFGNFIPITFYQMRHKNIEIARDANIKRIRLHDFRHSCASLLINNNANIAVVSQFLGHASIEETLDTYTHMFKDKLSDAVNTINKLTCPEPTIVDFGS